MDLKHACFSLIFNIYRFLFSPITWKTAHFHFLSKKAYQTLDFQNWFSSVQPLSRVRLFVTAWIAARQASLSITSSQSSLRFTSIESVMPSSHLILCRPLLLLPPIPPSIRVFPNESTLCMRWPKYWSFSFSIGLTKKCWMWCHSILQIQRSSLHVW